LGVLLTKYIYMITNNIMQARIIYDERTNKKLSPVAVPV